ncbi:MULTISPECIES: ROK family protein [Micromonospora]|uniref:ROK family transcriptional regulator n=1 Tax=Micromonospora solifontis TaxID=2487138 RepID=A0ABX9WC27_9ACTN|nr:MULTISPECIES: ROK family transcriptional regulator [Micromonospora]NES16589.1 ROK family transcriptional regulator [Micromonospora sp. PPF5-17B]NES38381.1 ROK family transcriptional regulator [Micromonospora solifontis]NES58368.1 ROK family transcriptional regulator [Micromonospora sp. PPF5-6]RNL95853.1 ROK family transcriptional regulator [Micromonospora solifontis]
MRTVDPLHVRLLRLLRDEGPVSRAELGDRLQMPRPRLLAELERLVGLGYVAEAGLAASRGGRRSTLVELSPRLRFAAVDLGASSIDVEVVNGRLEPVAAYTEPADIRSGPKVTLQRVNELLHKARVDGAYERLDAVGIGVPGPVSFRDGVPVSPPIMPGWDRFPVRELLTREHGCPAVVDNDVNIMAVGERHGGVAHSVDNFLFIKIGTGIGCGIYLNGEVYRGTDGCAGDIGHIQVDPNGPMCSCGNLGCLEAVFSGAALAREATAAARAEVSPALAERLAGRGAVTALDVAQGAAEGDVTCIQLIRDGGRRVGSVLAGLVSFTNPSMIVIGGGLAQLGHILLAEIRSVVYRRSLPLATGNLPVVLSELGPRAGVAGAAVLASELAFVEAS